MKRAVLARLAACLALTLLWVAGIRPAAALDCSSRRLGETEAAICQDVQLSRAEDQISGRLGGFVRRLSFGQYLGVRHWHADRAQERTRCGADRTCLGASYRAQIRFLDRLQQCLDTSAQRRACLRNTLNIEREASQRR
jgi:uncharacterized protein